MSKPKNKKSGTKHKKHRVAPRVARPESPTFINPGSITFGAMEALIDPENDPSVETYRKLIEEGKAAFEQKFGRKPGPEDLACFDPKQDTPTAPKPPTIDEGAQQLEAAGIRPQIIHAFRRTGFMVSFANKDKLPKKQLDEWQDAVDEYYVFKERADEAEARGEHPAIVMAIRRSGLLLPNPDELELQGNKAHTTGLTSFWMEAYQEWITEHPDKADTASQRFQELLTQATQNQLD